jgi:hypothetical protein
MVVIWSTFSFGFFNKAVSDAGHSSVVQFWIKFAVTVIPSVLQWSLGSSVTLVTWLRGVWPMNQCWIACKAQGLLSSSALKKVQDILFKRTVILCWNKLSIYTSIYLILTNDFQCLHLYLATKPPKFRIFSVLQFWRCIDRTLIKVPTILTEVHIFLPNPPDECWDKLPEAKQRQVQSTFVQFIIPWIQLSDAIYFLDNCTLKNTHIWRH